MNNAPYRICSTTIMDTIADLDITFDENGQSNYISRYFELIKTRVPEKQEAKTILDAMVARMKKDGEGKEYDCIIGVSGGVDSTYTAYYAKKILGLRPLAMHMDNGWNSELAVSNIEKVLKKLDIDLYTHVLDWNEFKDLQKSFLYASTPDGEVPSDHAIWGALYRAADKHGIKWMISGTNIKTEGILPRSWAQGHLDWVFMKDVQHRFGSKKLKTFPKLTYLNLFYFLALKRIKKFNLLDYIDYSKKDAMKVLTEQLGWVYYGGKHYESVYTRFFQGYILPLKFGIDKRKAHLSTLICSGEITRDQALDEIKKPPYPDEIMLKKDIEFVKKKLNLSDEEFTGIMQAPVKSYNDYSNQKAFMSFLMKIYSFVFHHKEKTA
jgi:N-acetyl sugar amidotransferase